MLLIKLWEIKVDPWNVHFLLIIKRQVCLIFGSEAWGVMWDWSKNLHHNCNNFKRLKKKKNLAFTKWQSFFPINLISSHLYSLLISQHLRKSLWISIRIRICGITSWVWVTMTTPWGAGGADSCEPPYLLLLFMSSPYCPFYPPSSHLPSHNPLWLPLIPCTWYWACAAMHLDRMSPGHGQVYWAATEGKPGAASLL